MNEQKATEFMFEVEKLCKKYRVFCELTTKSKPHLEFVEVRITAKVTESA